jgi:hypothetical protein
MRVAAALVIAVGAWSVVWMWPDLGPREEGVMSIELAANSGAMSDQRFLELTTELLQADRHYHFKMQQIMTAVNRHSFAAEGSTEPPSPLADADSGLRRASFDSSAEDLLHETWY